MTMFETIRCGDWVTTFNRFLGEQTGRATIHNKGADLWVLDLDGHRGLATAENVIRVMPPINGTSSPFVPAPRLPNGNGHAA